MLHAPINTVRAYKYLPDELLTVGTLLQVFAGGLPRAGSYL